jgi:hypothetical protein
VVLCASVLLGAPSCGHAPLPSEQLGDEAEALTVVSNALASGAAMQATAYRETSVAIDGAGTAIVASIDTDLPGATYCSHNAWAVSTNWNSGSPTWTQHTSNLEDWLPKPTLSDGSTSHCYVGDPTILATGPNGQFVYTSLITNGLVQDAVIGVSTDSGASFKNPVVVSTGASGNGFVDQPIAAVDRSSGVIWYLWRQTSSPVQWYMRKMHVNAGTGAIVFDTSPIKVMGTGAPAPLASAKSFTIGVGSPKTISTLWVAWPDSDDSGNQCLPGSAGATLNTNWYVSKTTDNGATWTQSASIYHDAAWPECVGPSNLGNVSGYSNEYGENRNRPQFVYDDVDMTCFLAFNHSSANGTVIEVFRSGGGPWTSAYKVPKPVALHDQWDPALGYVHKTGEIRGRLMVTWYDTRDDLVSNNKVSRYAASSTDGGTTWTGTPLRISIGTGVPWVLRDDWVDYDGVAGNPVDGAFVAAWADMRNATSIGQYPSVWAAGLVP